MNNVTKSDSMTGFNLFLCSQNKYFLVILDNSSAHRSNKEYLNIKTAFPKLNLTHSLQPYDVLVILTIKNGSTNG